MTKIPNCLVNCFEHLYFRHYNLFRISDFVLRNSKNWFRASCFEFAFLFNLGAPYVFATRPLEYPFHKSVIFSFTVLFYGASSVEYRLDQNRVVCPKHYSTGENHLSSNLPLFSELGAHCVFARTIFSPILSLSRQDRKDRKENFFPIFPNLAPFAPLRESSSIRFFPLLRPWRALREVLIYPIP